MATCPVCEKVKVYTVLSYCFLFKCGQQSKIVGFHIIHFFNFFINYNAHTLHMQVLTTNHMYAHMKIHTGEDRHECPQCKKVDKLNSLKVFLLVFINCKIIISSFIHRKKSLKNHLKTHATERVAFNCEHCGYVIPFRASKVFTLFGDI